MNLRKIDPVVVFLRCLSCAAYALALVAFILAVAEIAGWT